VRGIPWLHRSRGPETIATPCAIELTGTMEVEARGGALRVAADEPITLREGERLTLSSGARRVAYLAIEGGFDAPIIDRSRNALLGAGIGRPLRRGEILQCRSAADAARGATAPAPRSREPGIPALPNSALGAEQDLRAALCAADEVVLRAGPDLDDELRAQIEAAAFTISPTSDRAGTRLTGPALRASAVRLASTPMIEGAIELTPSGLVVLGPDHPTTGGYPVPAVLASESRDAFFALPLGAAVRFVFGDDA
jgi:allophanate hydrolase subunit 2